MRWIRSYVLDEGDGAVGWGRPRRGRRGNEALR
jgi:hypothetical protein